MSQPLRILITGASRGIGSALATQLLIEGHFVALCARTQSDLFHVAENFADRALVIPVDVLSPGAAELAIGEVIAKWDGIDALVLNAGDGVSAPIQNTTDAMWQHMMDLNATAPFRFVRAAVPHLKQYGGSIVVIASKAGLVGEPNVVAYTAAKHAVVGLVRAAASELSRYKIRVNALCPDYVDTPMTERTLSAAAERTGKSIADVKLALATKLNGHRLLTAQEVASTAIELLLDAETTGVALLLEGVNV